MIQMPTSQYNFLTKVYPRIPLFFLSKIGNCKIFKNPLDKFFIFFKLKYCPKSRYFTETNSRKESKQVENSNKKVIFKIVCCRGNSLQYTHMLVNEKEIPGVLQIFTVNARSLNPKLKQIVHFQFFILLQVHILLILQGATLTAFKRRPLSSRMKRMKGLVQCHWESQIREFGVKQVEG